MKRNYYFLVRRMVLGAALALFSFSSFGQTATVPTIDGDGSDAAWDQATIMPIEAIIDVSSVVDDADLSGNVSVLWSADSIYVRVLVLDDDLHNGPGNAYEYDNVCIYFDVFNKATDSYVDTTQMYFEKNWWAELDQMGGRFSPGWGGSPPGNWAIDTADGKTGYTLELAVGWTEFDKVPAAGDKLGFDVKLSDNDDDGVDGNDGRDQIAWRDITDTGWNVPIVWGEIMLNADGSVEGMTDFVPTTDGMGENDRGWAFTSAWAIETIIDDSTIDSPEDCSGDVSVLWTADSIYVMVNVLDDILYGGSGDKYNYDNICIYFDVFNKSTNSYVDSTQMYYEKNWWEAADQMSGRYGSDWMAPPYGNFAVDTMIGKKYTLELAVGWDEFDRIPAVGDKLGFDVKISDNDGVDGGEGRDQLAWRDNSDGGWNNPLLWGEITLGEDGMVSGQTDFVPTTDGMGENDRGWAFTDSWAIETVIDDSSIDDADDLSGDVSVLWSADSIYVMVNVLDDDLHVGPGDEYNYDNVCIYFDVYNKNTTSYEDSTYMYYEKHWWADATQVSGRYGSDWMAPPYGNFAVDTADGKTGYTIELAVGWDEFGRELAVGDMMGFDVKLSDNDDDGVDGGDGRDQLAWKDDSDGGWDNPSLYGTIELIENNAFAPYYGPEATTNLAATVDGSDVTLTWDAVDGVAGYNVYRGTDLIGDAIAEVTLTDAGLEDGTYEYSVTTLDAGGMESDAVTVSVDVITIGIDNVNLKVQVYPNPASDKLYIRSSEVIESISLISVTGKVVKSIDVNADYGSLDISELKSGMYIISVHSKDSVLNTRVLVE